MWGIGLLDDLLVVFHGFVFEGGRDGWVWRSGEDGMFCMNSCFKLIQRRTLGGEQLDLGGGRSF